MCDIRELWMTALLFTKRGNGVLCIARSWMTLLYPPFWSLLSHSDASMLRFDALVTICKTPTLGARRARKYIGGGDGQKARDEGHAEERGGKRACTAAGETECGCSCEDHVL